MLMLLHSVLLLESLFEESLISSSFVAPALARCDIGVQFSVRQSVRPPFRPQFMSTLAFKTIQITYSLKPLHP